MTLDSLVIARSVATWQSQQTQQTLDAVILAVAHDAFKAITLDKLAGIMNADPMLIDARGLFKPAEAEEKGFYYRSL